MITDRLAFESFGVAVTIDVTDRSWPGIAEAVEAVLPPGHRRVPCGPRADASLAITSFPGRSTVYGPGGERAHFTDEIAAIRCLDQQIRGAVALHAPDHTFIHAGVVAGRAGAIVIPGRSFAGKTTLVRALVTAGATYLSDEYAVLERSGRVAPYPRPLSLRTPDGRIEVPPSELGRVAAGPTDVAFVVSTTYRPDAAWEPVEGTRGDAALALIDNAVAVRARPGDVLRSTSRTLRAARYLGSPRGDAATTAGALLELVGGPEHPAPPTPSPVGARTTETST